MIKVKSSQKIFMDTEVATLTGICVEHLHDLAKARHWVSSRARPRQRVSRRISGCHAVGPAGSGDAASALRALSCASVLAADQPGGESSPQ